MVGRTYSPADMARQIAAASAAPVYGVLETYLGQGIVGGAFPSFEAHGKLAGRGGAKGGGRRGGGVGGGGGGVEGVKRGEEGRGEGGGQEEGRGKKEEGGGGGGGGVLAGEKPEGIAVHLRLYRCQRRLASAAPLGHE